MGTACPYEWVSPDSESRAIVVWDLGSAALLLEETAAGLEDWPVN
jgi:hypothetical protein